MEIRDHKLQGDDHRPVKYQESPNHGGKFNPHDLDTLIIHFTAGRSAQSSIVSMCADNVKNRASAHLVVGRDNSITQLVPFDTVAWHAGASSYGGRNGFNQYSIGIEIDNAGQLTKQGNNYVAWFGKSYPPEEVFEGVHRNQSISSYWHSYTEEQIDIVFELGMLLVETYGIKQILGHEEISPSRKVDPGPAFPLDKMRERILLNNRADNSPDIPSAMTPGINMENIKSGLVMVDSLNIRTGPSTNFSVAAASPLKKGALIQIVEEKGDWYKINMQGWVNKKFVKG